jgi:hypothetical protein
MFIATAVRTPNPAKTTEVFVYKGYSTVPVAIIIHYDNKCRFI